MEAALIIVWKKSCLIIAVFYKIITFVSVPFLRGHPVSKRWAHHWHLKSSPPTAKRQYVLQYSVTKYYMFYGIPNFLPFIIFWNICNFVQKQSVKSIEETPDCTKKLSFNKFANFEECAVYCRKEISVQPCTLWKRPTNRLTFLLGHTIKSSLGLVNTNIW